MRPQNDTHTQAIIINSNLYLLDLLFVQITCLALVSYATPKHILIRSLDLEDSLFIF